MLQRCVRRRVCARLHFGHCRMESWDQLRSQLRIYGVLHDVYPYPLVRHEWRTELSSWLAVQDWDPLIHDVVSDALYWGRPAPLLIQSSDCS